VGWDYPFEVSMSDPQSVKVGYTRSNLRELRVVDE
jgi:hypothetical protein